MLSLRHLLLAVERHATKDPGMRSVLKRVSVVCHPESEPRKKIALDTEQSSQHEVRMNQSPIARRTDDTIPSVTTSIDQHTVPGDVTREVRTGPTQDVTRTDSNDDIGDDVVMREENADENRAERPSSSSLDSRRRITTKRKRREVRDEQTSITEEHVPTWISGKTAPSLHTVAVTTQKGTGRIP